MSTGASDASGLGPLGRGLALGAPLLTALTLAAIVGLPPTEPDHELQLIAPDRVPEGAIVPLRVHLYAGLQRAQGPTLVTAPVQVELRGSDGSVWTRTALRAGFAATLEGAVRVPPGRHRRAILRASARYEDAELSVERELYIDRPGALPPAITPLPRELPPLRSLAVSPVRELTELQFEPFDVRVRGDACVPEAPCELLVYVGSAPITIVAEASASVSVAASTRSKPASVAALVVTPHGPEAELTLRAERDGTPVARAGVRLPLALGAGAISGAPDVIGVAAPVHVALHGLAQGCIVDAFRDGRWARTGSLRECGTPQPLPFAALEPGLWRVQLRSDRFGSDSAAVRSLYVAPPLESPARSARQLAAAVQAAEPHNALARALLAPPAVGPSTRELQHDHGADDDVGNSRYLLAVLDRGIHPLPVPASGHAAAVLRLQGARGQLRKLGLLALGACALTLAALLGQRGLDAAAQASRLLLAGGSDPRAARRARMRAALRVLATLCALLLAFAVIAAYVVARAASS